MKGLSKKDIAALREGDIVYVRMEVRRPIGDLGSIHCRIANEGFTSHYVPVFPEHIVGKPPAEVERQSGFGNFIPETLPHKPTTPPPAPCKK